MGMRDLLRKMKTNSFEDIIALLALFRPGPLNSGMVDDYIKRKHGTIPEKYDLPQLKNILHETHGVILYQEQVMKLASVLAGFSLGGADLLRRAMGKKKPEVMVELREKFVSGALKNKIPKKIAEKVVGLIEHFAGYGFNNSHRAPYSIISYWTELNKTGTKQRWELERTFDVKRRLANWFNNVSKFSGSKSKYQVKL